MKKKKAKKRSMKEEGIWRESLAYLKESKNYVYFVAVLFFLSSIIGFIFSEQFTFFNSLLETLSSEVQNLGTFDLIWFIFQNNISGAFIGMMLGFALGVVPIFNALTNGTLLGYVYSLTVPQVGAFVPLLYLLPHGVFELPAIFISLGIGMKFGMFILAPSGRKWREFKRRFWNSLKVFITIVLPLLIIAAIIEGILIGFG